MTPVYFLRSPLPTPSLTSPYSATPLFAFKPMFSSSCRQKPISVKVPARDRVIDFGKHRGRMLGTLPSKYLTWVSKNLRARDFEEWAKLADEVLLDPIYKDRIEWESAEMILSGEGLRAYRSESPVSGLLEISERFGWDNEDKVGWNKVDFELLGTSRGGRIPRRKLGEEEDGEALAKERGIGFLSRDSRVSNRKQMGFVEKRAGLEMRKLIALDTNRNVLQRKSAFLRRDLGNSQGEEMELGFVSSRDSRDSKISNTAFSFKRVSEINGDSRNSGFLEEESSAIETEREFNEERKLGFLSKGSRFILSEDHRVDEEEETERARREDRRERRMLRKGQQLQMLRREIGLEEERSDGIAVKQQIGRKSNGYSNPFPGREALLDKIRRREE